MVPRPWELSQQLRSGAQLLGTAPEVPLIPTLALTLTPPQPLPTLTLSRWEVFSEKYLDFPPEAAAPQAEAEAEAEEAGAEGAEMEEVEAEDIPIVQEVRGEDVAAPPEQGCGGERCAAAEPRN